LAHAFNRAPAMAVVAVEWKRRRLIVVDGAQPVALRGQHMTFAQRSVTARAVRIGNTLPFPVPGMIVRRINAIGGDTTLGNRRPPRLRSPHEPQALDRQILAFGPQGPANKVKLS